MVRNLISGAAAALTLSLPLVTRAFVTDIEARDDGWIDAPETSRLEARRIRNSRRDRRPPRPDTFEFVTRPDIGAPIWDIEYHVPDQIAPGYWFVAPYANLDQDSFPKWNGPHIYDGDGQLIWSGAPQLEHYNSFDFRTVTVNGQPMLSLIAPHDEHAEGVILDDAYEVYANVDLLGNLSSTNMHDFTVADDGETALTLMNDHGPTSLEKSMEIGYNGSCRAGWEGFKEIRVSDGSVIFEWRARDWISLTESQFIPSSVPERCSKGSWDILHLNSIDKFPDGDFLVSSRHMNALWKINHTDGSVVWRLGGPKSNFPVEGDLKFSRQHHARVYSQNATHTLVSVFDNAAGSGPQAAETPSRDISRGLLISLETTADPPKASLIAHYDHPKHGRTNSRGSISFLENGNVFMGWTYSSRQSEHSPDGRVLMTSRFRIGGAHSYRNYKFPWVGRPRKAPDVASSAISDTVTNKGKPKTSVTTLVHVSWNGATEVKKWRAYRSTPDGKAKELAAVTKRSGFETALEIDGYASYVILEALDHHDVPLPYGTTEAIKTNEPADMDNKDVATELRWQQEQQAAVEAQETALPEEEDDVEDEQDDDQDDSTATDDLWDRVLDLLGNPIVLFLSGCVCSAVICIGTMGIMARTRAARSWWRGQGPVYESLEHSREDVRTHHTAESDFGNESTLFPDEDEEDEVGKEGEEKRLLVEERDVEKG